MNSKTKGFLYTLLIGAVLVPAVYMSGVSAVEPVCDGYAITGDTLNSYYVNTGSLDFDGGSVCVGVDGTVSGRVESSNIGMIYFDRNGASATVDFATGVWSGTAYAPLNDYNQDSASGTFFELSGVQTSLVTGALSGNGYSTNLGELSFVGAYQGLAAVEVGINMQIETFGDTRVSDGYPVADGKNSGYRLVATVYFDDVPFATESFVENDFEFTGTVSVADGSNLKLNQLTGEGDANNALKTNYVFEYDSYEDGMATYHLDISSYAPTSDAYCGDMTDLEKCSAPFATYTYGIDGVEVSGSMPGEFTWAETNDNGTTFTELATVDGTASVTSVAQNLPFAPMYEVDDFGVIATDGYVATSSDEVPTLAENVPYDFSGVFVQNGDNASAEADLSVNYEIYEIDDADYTFAGLGCGAASDSSFTISNVLGGEILNRPEIDPSPFRDIQICPSGDGGSLDSGSNVTATTSITVRFFNPGKTAYYPSEYFSFADTRASISENPRVYVTGTVSGLAQGDDVTVVGNMGKLELRDALFEQITKATKNVDTDSLLSGGLVGSDWSISSGGRELSGGDILYFIGDGPSSVVEVTGGLLTDEYGDPISKTIVVVGANLFIDSSILKVDGSEGEIGFIVLADEDGHGGNLFVDNDVTDLHANMFLDGSFLRANESGVNYGPAELTNQLYILGSIVSDNTIEGYEEDTSCVCGNGDECVEEDVTPPYCTETDALHEDLQYTSYFRVCCTTAACEYDGGGNVAYSDLHPYEECSGYERSTYDGENSGGEWSFPLIIEYSPPSSNMPIFSSGGSSVGN